MADISVYSFVDDEGEDESTYTTQDYQEAKEYASKYGLLIMENVYEWTEAIPLDDFRTTDAGWKKG